MKATDLHLLELLELHPEQGSIQFKNRRMLLWDADAFGILRKELIETVGAERARPIMRRFGFANGYRDALMTRELFSWDNDSEWWLSCPALQRHEGKVLTEPQKLTIDRERGIFDFEVSWANSYEASQHHRMFGNSDAPVCWTLTGFASGFATALMGEEVFFVERGCAAMGGDRCRVHGRTRKSWAADGHDHAADYEAKPLTAELESLEAELRQRRKALRKQERASADRPRSGTLREGFVCKSRAMDHVLDLATTVARVDTTVLIAGESGTGKERVARYVHGQSPRRSGPFVAINCGALPETLLESELFGHMRGAFTGATSDKKGLFEAAAGGTILLDEIGEMTPTTQVKLLRVLQEREVLPVGATEPVPIDVRVVASTHRDLARMVERGEFRKDLFYRLRVVVIELPPLRARRADILPLARELVAETCESHHIEPKSLTPEAAELLLEYPFPGNVRELSNAIERAVVLSGDRKKLDRSDFPTEVRKQVLSPAGLHFGEVISMADLERRYVLEVLERFDGNRTHTARALGIGANTLWRKLKSWGVPPARRTA